jgi:Ulp1 protease family, C-terminal catalytic domain
MTREICSRYPPIFYPSVRISKRPCVNSRYSHRPCACIIKLIICYPPSKHYHFASCSAIRNYLSVMSPCSIPATRSSTTLLPSTNSTTGCSCDTSKRFQEAVFRDLSRDPYHADKERRLEEYLLSSKERLNDSIVDAFLYGREIEHDDSSVLCFPSAVGALYGTPFLGQASARSVHWHTYVRHDATRCAFPIALYNHWVLCIWDLPERKIKYYNSLPKKAYRKIDKDIKRRAKEITNDLKDWLWEECQSNKCEKRKLRKLRAGFEGDFTFVRSVN